MSLLQHEPLILIRYPEPTKIKGHYTKGTPTIILCYGNVQPLNGDELKLLPEGNRTKGSIKIYTEISMYDDDIIRRNNNKYNISQIDICTIDNVIDQIKAGEKPELPELIINKKRALSASDILNPYAYSKAMASFEAARQVASLSTEGVFKIKDRDEALPVLSAAHELIRHAAILADEAREIEKANDTVVRIAHFKKGNRRKKIELHGKYKK